MFYTAIMLMGRRMRTFKEGLTGCWKSPSCISFLCTILKSRVAKEVLAVLGMIMKWHIHKWTVLSVPGSFSSQNQLPSQATDAGSSSNAYTAEYEDADSDYCQARSRYHSFLGLQQYEDGTLMDASLLPSNVQLPSLNQYDHRRLQEMTVETNLYSGLQENIVVLGKTGLDLAASGYNTTTQFGLTLQDEGLDNTAIGFPSASFQVSPEKDGPARLDIPKQVTLTFGELLKDELTIQQRDDGKVELQFVNPDVSYATSILNAKTEFPFEESLTVGKQPSLDISNIGEGLKKYDSFSKWMSRELGEVEHPHTKSNSEADWNFMESEHVEDSGMSQSEQLDAYMMGPSVSQDQLFSIIDFSPSWAYNSLETKVLITGIFLKDKDEVENIKLSCMFGEVEVPVEILAGRHPSLLCSTT
ncbi:calmodulin-binding transcription activator 3-like [Iris pallida]|uniref:Calmodulin-binding transcription activator 3-like n=1 Tax=Iris pallida TaxID=29817 RepID=A0AAX6DIT9_IRIPA|nr:calmodulin-binding transcription activator 3-like [Iris pallida]